MLHSELYYINLDTVNELTKSSMTRGLYDTDYTGLTINIQDTIFQAL